MLCYDDGLGTGKNLLALKTTDSEQEECSIWVYQCIGSVSAAGNCWPDLHWSLKMNVDRRALPVNAVFPSSPSKQEQAQSICKVLSASFDCALTSDKAWGRWATERLENRLKTEKYFQVAIISPFLPPQPAGDKIIRGDRTVYPQNVKAWNKASAGGERSALRYWKEVCGFPNIM